MKKKLKKFFSGKYKVIKIVGVICISIIILEAIGVGIFLAINKANLTHYSVINNLKEYDNNYYGVGFSNFRESKFNKVKYYKYDGVNTLTNQAQFVKYDKDMNILFELTYKNKYDSAYYDMIKVSDGYICVGSYVKNEEMIDLNTREGLIVKYDFDGNMIWHKNYQVLGDTEFFRVVEDNNGIIVVGQSIYENMEIGNHPIGGGIIVKYDYDGEVVWYNNFGGNKSGIFNDIVVLKDGYICVGKDGALYGLICKFDKEGNLVYNVSSYGNFQTDATGFSRAKVFDNKLYISGSYNTNKDENKDNTFDGAIYVYDLKGNYIKRFRLRNITSTHFYDFVINKDYLLAVGCTTNEDEYKNPNRVLAKFDLKGNLITKNIIGTDNTEFFTSILESDKYIISGYSNNKDGKNYIYDFNYLDK